MEFEFEGQLFHWQGPSPYHFIRVPPELGGEIQSVARLVTYGWGVVPVTVGIGATEWTTSLVPKDGGYLVPIKDAVRRGERLVVGAVVSVRLSIAM